MGSSNNTLIELFFEGSSFLSNVVFRIKFSKMYFLYKSLLEYQSRKVGGHEL